MPIPKPNKGEKKDEFISRCMGDSTMNKDFPDNSQRYAICIGQFGKKENEDILDTIKTITSELNEIKNKMSEVRK